MRSRSFSLRERVASHAWTLKKLLLVIRQMSRHPLISIAMPVYNVDPRWLMLAVQSVREQYYPHWELCIADDASTNPGTRAALDRLIEEGDARIKIVRLPNNVGIAEGIECRTRSRHRRIHRTCSTTTTNSRVMHCSKW